MIGYLSLIIGIIIHTNGCTKSRNEKILNIYINRIAENVELIINYLDIPSDEYLLFKKLRLYLEFIILDKTEHNNLELNEVRNDLIYNLTKKIPIIINLIEKLISNEITDQEKKNLFLLFFILIFFERLEILLYGNRIDIDKILDTGIIELIYNNDIIKKSKYVELQFVYTIMYYSIIELENLHIISNDVPYNLLNILNDLNKISMNE